MKSLENWVLDPDHTVRQVPWDEWLEWAKQGFDKTKRVDKTTIGDAEVSTVFLSIDHNWAGGPPVLFETMIFGGAYPDQQWRYHTWDEATAGHRRIVDALTDGREP